MARETRVALLVGLAFIGLFGLILGQRKLQVPSDSLAAVPKTEPAAPGAELISAVVQPSTVRVVDPSAPPTPVSEPPVIAEVPAPAPVTPPAIAPDSRRVADGRSPELPPSPTTRPVPSFIAPVVASAQQRHTIAAGDTLTRLARRYYGTTNEREFKRIAAANGISETAMLNVGRVLVIPPLPTAVAPVRDGTPLTDLAVRPETEIRLIPPPDRTRTAERTTTRPSDREVAVATSRSKHIVKPGQTISGIARQYGVSVDDIVRVNRIRDPRKLNINTELTIPARPAVNS